MTESLATWVFSNATTDLLILGAWSEVFRERCLEIKQCYDFGLNSNHRGSQFMSTVQTKGCIQVVFFLKKTESGSSSSTPLCLPAGSTLSTPRLWDLLNEDVVRQ